VFFLGIFQVDIGPLPQMDMEQLFPLVMALLGMASLRTFEKSKKITK